MSQFLRLLNESDKAKALSSACALVRRGELDSHVFEVEPESFKAIPGEPFAYWVSESVVHAFVQLPPFEGNRRVARLGGHSSNDERWLRLSWESSAAGPKVGVMVPYAKGGAYSRFYADIHLQLHWDKKRETYHGFFGRIGRPNVKPESVEHYFRPGLTWPRRTQGGLSLRAMPAGCIFADKGPAAFVADDDPEELLALLALANSRAFGILVSLQMAFGSYEVGVIQKTPVPDLSSALKRQLAELASTAWSLKRMLDTTTETSHAFSFPAALFRHSTVYAPSAIEAELTGIQTQIDDLAFDLYGFFDEGRQSILSDINVASNVDESSYNGDQAGEEVPSLDALLSWTVGVSFGRFDWRLVTGEREAPPEPDPFDPLPAKSPGMLPDGAEPYHRHAGILVDDPGHEHNLPRLMADVLETVDAQVDEDLRRWLRRDFFKYHLQQYSKSRRKAPIYWPLATSSSSYTLWLYYPALTDQTLFTAVNDFVEPKLKQVESELGNLRLAGASRSRGDEKRLEELSDFRDELADLRDTLLTIAPDYKPNHDDGVQITAAPLWPLFRHKPWQKVLQETWEKLEQGDYDWAHLAMAYWPERVREKCVTDKSLSIAHDLEHLYVEPEAAPKKARGRKKNTGSGE
ncbi:BREX-1 system adenine-specific DNA-methyltransferase PglX [Ectothiorhodospira variabilis]|uniref:BREX-1 system adenine-specific DNA-methyltransferase PglX n=1 Tax=Ectothiorhodospira variabilis TaxID=505694 RepID=UPI001EFC132F|nr:BREX-1 system adenine-specific DNA-methyltransferase PglX [Ectothiorhodospira variabilis]MCG5496108.1 BREX-1 system adenine-specific DNA-methyltransferase PglX [Ectothiorhodospira variabilis]